MNVAIIPARGGSKRIPRKNIKLFCGKPMIAWSIEAAMQSGCFDEVIISTDDQEIAEVALQYGASVPFFRPPELSDDHTGTTAVIAHAVQNLLDRHMKIDNVCCLYATAPFVLPADLIRGREVLETCNINFAFSATSYAFPVQRAIRLLEESRVAMLQPKYFETRSQDLEEAWHDAGQFYWGKCDAWLERRMLFTEDSIAIKLPRHRVQDIDTPEDWERAELMFRAIELAGKPSE